MTTVRAAAVHAAPVFLDTDKTTQKAIGLIQEAAAQGANLVVFPEVFLPGFPYWVNCYPPIVQTPINVRYAAASVEITGPEIAAVRDTARKEDVHVVLGVSERDGGSLYNTQVFIDAGGRVVGTHRKLQPTYAERLIWAQGDGSTLRVFDTEIGRIGGLVCWEHTMNLARHALIAQGEEVHAGSWPGLSTLVGFADVFDPQVEAMSRNHAITGQTFVVVAASPVSDEMLDVMHTALGEQQYLTAGGGWSAIIHPMTNYLAGPHTGAEESIMTADLDLDEIAGVKSFVDATGHYSRREILQLTVDTEPKDAARFRPGFGPVERSTSTDTGEGGKKPA